MKKVRLETIFLAKVVLCFNQKEHVRNFLTINKKCLDAVKMLKVNPSFINSPSIKWFYKHFKPETVFCEIEKVDIIEEYKDCCLIRNPSFYHLHEQQLLTEEIFQMICPKVTFLNLLMFSSYDESEQRKVYSKVCQNSQLFTRLNILFGDIQCVTEFLENFTNNGKDVYIRMPEKIVIDSYNGYPIEWSLEIADYIRRIERCLPDTKRVNANVLIKKHPTDETVLSHFKKIHYYYKQITSNMCDLLNDRLVMTLDFITINGCMKNNDYNTIIENCYPPVVYYRDVPNRKDENWTVPKCVQQMRIIACRSETRTFQDVNVDMSHLESLYVSYCSAITFDKRKFDHLKYLTIKSWLVNFLDCEFPVLEVLTFDQTLNLRMSQGMKFPSLKTIKCISSSYVEIFGKFENLKELVLVQCKNISLEIETFKGKHVYMEDCTCIHFINDWKIEMNPLKDDGIETEKATSLMKGIFQYPMISNDLENFTRFQLRQFIPKSDRIQIINNKVKRLNKLQEYEIDMIVSYNFYSEDTKKEDFLFKSSNGEIHKIKGVRYLEIIVTGFACISLGLFSTSKYYSFEDHHIGWEEHSIGYHSDDGFIYSGDGDKRIDTQKPYGDIIGVTNCAGVGFIAKTKEVFFTFNGEFIRKEKIGWNDVSCAIGLQEFESLEINTGENENFVYDFKEFKPKNVEKCVIV